MEVGECRESWRDGVEPSLMEGELSVLMECELVGEEHSLPVPPVQYLGQGEEELRGGIVERVGGCGRVMWWSLV